MWDEYVDWSVEYGCSGPDVFDFLVEYVELADYCGAGTRVYVGAWAGSVAVDYYDLGEAPDAYSADDVGVWWYDMESAECIPFLL